MVDEVEPRALRPGSTLRFRVEDPNRALESSTWSIVGSKKSGDLYFSNRQVMSDLKISLHQSGITRMAWTEAAASSRVVSGDDRVFSRWTVTEPAPNGWEMVLSLYLPDSALSQILPRVPGRKTRPTIALPPAGPGGVIMVRVLVGRPGCGNIRVEGTFEEVGRMVLGDGAKVLVTAWNHLTTDQLEKQIAAIRARAIAEGALDRPVPRSFGWGKDRATGVPTVIDVGDPRPADAVPPNIPHYDGSSDLQVYTMHGELDPPAVGDVPSSTPLLE